MMESVALGDSHMVEVDYVFIERDMDVDDESTYDHCEDAEFFISKYDSSPALSTVESGSLVSASETGDTTNRFDGEAASGATIVSEDEDEYDDRGLGDMMLESGDTSDRTPVGLTPSTSTTKTRIAESRDAASVARIEMGSSVDMLQTSEPNPETAFPEQKSDEAESHAAVGVARMEMGSSVEMLQTSEPNPETEVRPEQNADEACVTAKGSRKSNKKRRKRMKKLKKEAAAAAAAAALSEIKSSEQRTHDEAGAKGKRSKSKNLNKHRNIAVACATETLVTFRETQQEKERKRVAVATRYVC